MSDHNRQLSPVQHFKSDSLIYLAILSAALVSATSYFKQQTTNIASDLHLLATLTLAAFSAIIFEVSDGDLFVYLGQVNHFGRI